MRNDQGERTYAIVGGTIICYSGGSGQHLASFTTATRLTAHHDERLADLTRILNEAIAAHPASRGAGDGRDLAIIHGPDGLMLAWTQNSDEKIRPAHEIAPGALTYKDSTEADLRKALGLD